VKAQDHAKNKQALTVTREQVLAMAERKLTRSSLAGGHHPMDEAASATVGSRATRSSGWSSCRRGLRPGSPLTARHPGCLLRESTQEGNHEKLERDPELDARCDHWPGNRRSDRRDPRGGHRLVADTLRSDDRGHDGRACSLDGSPGPEGGLI